ncbi:MAG: hypothetical protein Ct9H300mP8_11430 [Gammaproteobacteria bacterium]|nr:MAG: hypothetical protein Ct9H300mP8_11430 [Gammaproteobacteria bacterium]
MAQSIRGGNRPPRVVRRTLYSVAGAHAGALTTWLKIWFSAELSDLEAERLNGVWRPGTPVARYPQGSFGATGKFRLVQTRFNGGALDMAPLAEVLDIEWEPYLVQKRRVSISPTLKRIFAPLTH